MTQYRWQYQLNSRCLGIVIVFHSGPVPGDVLEVIEEMKDNCHALCAQKGLMEDWFGIVSCSVNYGVLHLPAGKFEPCKEELAPDYEACGHLLSRGEGLSCTVKRVPCPRP